MKNGEAILSAAKVLAKEFSIGMKAELEGLRAAADKAKEAYKDGSLVQNVKQTVEKEKAAAEVVLSAQMENIGNEVQKIKEQLDQLKKEKAAAVEENCNCEDGCACEKRAE